MRLVFITVVISTILIGLSWSRDATDAADGGIHVEYDEDKWVDINNPLGDDYDPNADVLEELVKKFGTPTERKDELKSGDDNKRERKRDRIKEDDDDKKTKEMEKDEFDKNNNKNLDDGDIHDETEEHNNDQNEVIKPTEPETGDNFCSVDEKSYFKHFIRVFSNHMQPLDNENYKYGAQVMLQESDYIELQDLLNSDHPNNNLLLEAMSRAFVPLSRSPMAFITPYMSVQWLSIGLIGSCVLFVFYLLVNRMMYQPMSIFRNMMILFFVCFLISVPWEWYRMYQKALSEKVANSLKLVPDSCRPSSKISPFDSLLIWLKDSFTLADDECVKYHENMLVDPIWEVSPFQFQVFECYEYIRKNYYENMLVDPIWEVSPFQFQVFECYEYIRKNYYENMLVDPIWEVSPSQAITVCSSRFFMEPMKLFASASGQCFRLFFKEVPVQWQPFVFVACCMLFSLLIMTQAGFEIWTPLIRLGVRPRDDRELAALQNENARLREEVQEIKYEMQRRPVLPAQDVPQLNGAVEVIGAQRMAYVQQDRHEVVRNEQPPVHNIPADAQGGVADRDGAGGVNNERQRDLSNKAGDIQVISRAVIAPVDQVDLVDSRLQHEHQQPCDRNRREINHSEDRNRNRREINQEGNEIIPIQDNKESNSASIECENHDCVFEGNAIPQPELEVPEIELVPEVNLVPLVEAQPEKDSVQQVEAQPESVFVPEVKAQPAIDSVSEVEVAGEIVFPPELEATSEIGIVPGVEEHPNVDIERNYEIVDRIPQEHDEHF